jgi:hypothetical protein
MLQITFRQKLCTKLAKYKLENIAFSAIQFTNIIEY